MATAIQRVSSRRASWAASDSTRVGRLIDSQVVLWGIRAKRLRCHAGRAVRVAPFPRLVPVWIRLYLLGVGVIKVAALV